MALSWITLKNAETHWKVLLYRGSAAGTQSIKSFRGEWLSKQERKKNYKGAPGQREKS